MIHRGKVEMVMKNTGAMMVAITIIVGVFYTILNSHIIVIAQGNIGLRILGLCIVSCLAYLPYFISQKIFLRTKWLSFFWGLWVIFAVWDIVLRLDLIISFLYIPGFFGIVTFPLLFSFVISGMYLGEVVFYKYIYKKKCCYKIISVLKKKYFDMLLRMKKI